MPEAEAADAAVPTGVTTAVPGGSAGSGTPVPEPACPGTPTASSAGLGWRRVRMSVPRLVTFHTVDEPIAQHAASVRLTVGLVPPTFLIRTHPLRAV